MQKFGIDYRNGALGNTILTHVLYASNQIDIDLENFFSSSGNAHKISAINHTSLVACHWQEKPDAAVTCLVSLITRDWTEVLRTKLSYKKWKESEPNLSNWSSFFSNTAKFNLDTSWMSFYNSIKDQSWPPCRSFSQINTLPAYIQEEIIENWKPPTFDITNNLNLLEFLTLCYHDSLSRQSKGIPGVATYDLAQYLTEDLRVLEKLAGDLGWQWNQSRSHEFYLKMLEINKCYLDWLESMKQSYQKIVDDVEWPQDLAIWEYAMLLAKICLDLDLIPSSLHWTNADRIFHDHTVKLHTLIGTQ